MRVSTLLVSLLIFSFWACQKEESPTINSPGVGGDPVGNIAISVIEDTFEDTPIVVVGSGMRNILTAFERTFAGGVRVFSPVEDKFPIIMEDDLGNQWSVYGEAIEGPNKGDKLNTVNTGMGYWFIFGAFYPGAEIYGDTRPGTNITVDTSEEWGVPEAFVAQGAGFDAIPALDNPDFDFLASETDYPQYLKENDLIVAVSLNGETKVYPHPILDWHEIVNDEVGGTPITVTYCPLTGTTKVWKKENNGPDFTFGVSGFLYNSNVIPFDRGTESFWSQLEATSIFGPRKGERLEMIPFVETSWETWKSFETSSTVLSDQTGFDRDYSRYPYGDYKTSEVVAFPLLYNDERLHEKERVLGVIINGKAKVYRLSNF